MSVSSGQVVQGVPVGRAGGNVDVVERRPWQVNGFLGLVTALGLFGVSIWLFARADGGTDAVSASLGSLALLLSIVLFAALTVVQPGRTKVVQYFGTYVGTVRTPGLMLTVPLGTRRSVSVRVRNFETARMKVNDKVGNPVDVAAIIVWQVEDTAKATFAVEKYDEFVETQAEAAVRHVAGRYPYDAPEGQESLRGSTENVSAELAVEVAARVAVAGVEIVETRISHLAYAQEIAQAMLQRQQADAVVAARSRIVEGAVGMVELALDRLDASKTVHLDDERRAAMVSNLLVVLAGDSRVSPIVNTGTLYQ